LKPRHVVAVTCAWLVALSAHGAAADEGRTQGDAASPSAPAADERDPDAIRRRLRSLMRKRPYFDLLGTVMFGEGLRFNNPYRLAHELGGAGESLSTTAPYLDLALAATTGDPDGIQHGARLGWSVSMSGVPQQVITPAYLALLRYRRQWLLFGWAGLPFLAEPDFNVGGELAIGAAWFARAGFGAMCALVGDGFYGAGTRETRAAFYPVLSGQLGFFVSYEVLP